MWTFPLFPDKASSFAASVDVLFFVWLALAAVVTCAVFILIVYFAVKYRAGSRADRVRAPAPQRRRISRRIEVAWILAPLALFLASDDARACSAQEYIVDAGWL